MLHNQVVTIAEDSGDAHEQDTYPKNPEVQNHDPMGHSVLDNMEISMVHVLPAEFHPNTSQPNFLDDDMVAEKAAQVDFVATEEIE
ncbi:hypothetical protein EV2_045172 [Malus domestica]